jgi:hypothetical protein
MKQGKWWAWDSRGGITNQPHTIQLVNFDLALNLAAWERSGAQIIGSIESGRLTYISDDIHIELWREDQPNPTPYTKVINPDVIDPNDGDVRTHPKE